MISSLLKIGLDFVTEIIKAELSPEPDPEAERQALLNASRAISDELARRQFAAKG